MANRRRRDTDKEPPPVSPAQTLSTQHPPPPPTTTTATTATAAAPPPRQSSLPSSLIPHLYSAPQHHPPRDSSTRTTLSAEAEHEHEHDEEREEEEDRKGTFPLSPLPSRAHAHVDSLSSHSISHSHPQSQSQTQSHTRTHFRTHSHSHSSQISTHHQHPHGQDRFPPLPAPIYGYGNTYGNTYEYDDSPMGVPADQQLRHFPGGMGSGSGMGGAETMARQGGPAGSSSMSSMHQYRLDPAAASPSMPTSSASSHQRGYTSPIYSSEPAFHSSQHQQRIVPSHQHLQHHQQSQHHPQSQHQQSHPHHPHHQQRNPPTSYTFPPPLPLLPLPLPLPSSSSSSASSREVGYYQQRTATSWREGEAGPSSLAHPVPRMGQIQDYSRRERDREREGRRRRSSPSFMAVDMQTPMALDTAPHGYGSRNAIFEHGVGQAQCMVMDRATDKASTGTPPEEGMEDKDTEDMEDMDRDRDRALIIPPLSSSSGGGGDDLSFSAYDRHDAYAYPPVGSLSISAPPSANGKRRRAESVETDDNARGTGKSRNPRKTAVACNFCRGRKLRCNGVKPSCYNCTVRKFECEYVPIQRRRGPGKAPKGSRSRKAQQAGGSGSGGAGRSEPSGSSSSKNAGERGPSSNVMMIPEYELDALAPELRPFTSVMALDHFGFDAASMPSLPSLSLPQYASGESGSEYVMGQRSGRGRSRGRGSGDETDGDGKM
ncbi:unnamed protein product [Cyclocybe aegerita]|uniref:Zn(2)-C6 fungal-type domain-containing protein n=1 Tax=Cyclocybe aegerita TaxID=1973307 RepID=A0A8S0VXY5_CYCAE|nr:unnamed protein product [Cyclocybe aegerita]